jgi:glycosyltransferase involved in cell wall biosynthesis
MIRVLVFLGHYLPGEKSGGPARSIANLVEALGDECAFSIVTSDHDLGSSTRYDNILTGEWMTVGKAKVLYVADDQLTLVGVRSILRHAPHDVLYLNGVLSDKFSIIPMVLRKLGLVPLRPVVIASRGEFSLGALALKPLKKVLFLAVARVTRLYRQPSMTWQASTSAEEADIRRVFQGPSRTAPTNIVPNLLRNNLVPNVVTAVDVTSRRTAEQVWESGPKRPGELNAVFLSRISPKKNLLGVLKALNTVRGTVWLTVYGPIEDRAYWHACLATIKALPVNIQVHYGGVVENRLVGTTLSQHQLFVFPTFGENFGHVIAEALMAGCPVLTTDATPWEEIERCGAGTIVRGTAPADVAAAIQRHIDMDEVALRRMSGAAKALGERRADDPEAIAQNRALFVNAVCEARVS